MPEIHIHGTPDYQELAALGWTPADVTVFSSNINPFGPPPAVIEAVRTAANAATIATYPDRFSSALRCALAAYHDVDEGSILVGNGTADIMWLLAHVYGQGAHAVIVEPTFSEYRNALSLVRARISAVSHPGWNRSASGEYVTASTTVDDCATAIAKTAPDLVFICNPNNPSGHTLTPAQLRTLHEAAPDALWIVDEAYADFTAEPWSAAAWAAAGGWIVLRSMTKDFALGGLRVGYLIGAPAQIDALNAAQPPWNVNNVAQIAGVAALDELAWRTATMARLREEVAGMRQSLRSMGFHPLPTTVNYFLLLVGDAAAVRTALFRQKLIVRDCTSFGLPYAIRIAMQLPEQNARLVDAMRRLASTPKSVPEEPTEKTSG